LFQVDHLKVLHLAEDQWVQLPQELPLEEHLRQDYLKIFLTI
tara:strand:+ start:221 stop:346 length:126 start_codon:yes stop_codon:yes gene_type:complete